MSDPLSRVVAALEARGCDPRPRGGNKFDARCPLHRGARRNLTVDVGDTGNVLLHCHHIDEHGRPTCTVQDIVGALDLEMTDLFPENSHTRGNGSARKGPRLYSTWQDAAFSAARGLGVDHWTCVWTYHDINGDVVMRVVRFDTPDGKSYRPISGTDGAFRIGDPPGLLPIYALPVAVRASDVVILEGEKCCDALAAHGYVTTTSSHGASSAGKTDWSPLAGKDVTIVPDCDSAGEGYAAAVIRLLARLDPRPRVRIARLHGLADGEDIVEFLAKLTARQPWDGVNSAMERVRCEVRALVLAAEPVDLDAVLDDPQPEHADPRAEPAEDRWPPLRLRELPFVDPFPLDVLPVAVRDLVTAGASAIGCPPDFLALPVLAIAAGVIGRSISLRLKHNYFVPATLFGACVGPPSDGKSPALRAVAAPCRSIDESLQAEFDRDLEAWEQEAEFARSAKPKRPPPPRPRPRRVDLDDATMESIVGVLADNPRGVVMIKDELTALVLGLNQYKSGRGPDRANLLSIWSGSAIKKDRVSNEGRVPVRCPHPCMSVIGGLTPDMLGELVDARGRADGFLDRFLFAYPDPLPVNPWASGGIPEDVAEAWEVIVRRLWERPMAEKDGRSVPHVMMLDPDAEAVWADRYNALAAAMNAEDFAPALRGPWGKMRDYAGRLALNLACLHHAADPWLDPRGLPRADALAVHGAWKLIGYFQSHAARVHAVVTDGAGAANANAQVVRAIVAWLRAGRRAALTVSELKDARRWIGDADLADALKFLSDRGAIRPRPAAKPGPQGGRPPSRCYDVNPALYAPEDSR